jgi:tetratricopeptide (TPR) repeat protein
MNGQVVYGQALYDAGRYDDAEATFQTALTLDPENLIALRHLGDIAKSKHDAPKAIEWYQRVLDADPRNDEILGFLDELKAAEAARTPTPVMTPAVTPLETPAVPAAEARPSAPTPVAPAAAAPPPEPPKRPSIGLMDLAVDFGAEPAAPPPAPAPEAPAAPMGDIELNDLSFDSPAAEAPAPPPPGFEEPVLDIPRDVPAADDAINFGTTDVDLTSSAGNLHAFDRPSTPPTGTPEVFVTETMAELYLQQGFRDEALQVYRQLAELNPTDESIKDRIRHLESGDRASMSFAAVSDDVAPAADAADAAGTELPSAAADAPAEAVTDAVTDAPADDLMLGDLSLPPMDAIAHDAPAADPEPAAPVGGLELTGFDAFGGMTEPEPPVAEVAPAIEPDPTFDAPVAAPEPAAAAPVVPAPPAQPVLTARMFFAALAQRRPVRADGTPPVAAPVVPAVPSVPAPEPAAAVAAGGSLDALFGGAVPDAADDAMGRALATAVAVDDAAPIRGRPTQQATTEFSLDSVFRGGDAATRTSAPARRPSEVLNFDQFFSAGGAEPADPPAAPIDPAAASPADDAQFNQWLKGLKGQ